MIGNLFKGVFGIFIVLGALIFGVSLLATYQMSGSIGSMPIWIIAAICGIVIWQKSRKNEGPSTAGADGSKSKSANIFHGHGGDIELREDSIAITRHGAASFLTQGMKGEKRIPFASITAVQLKDAGRSIGGYIQFSILGGNESNRGIFDATLDENTVMFSKEQASRFRELRDIIEAKLAEARRPQVAVAPQSIADELSKLADLRAKGILTDEEFSRQKAHILAS